MRITAITPPDRLVNNSTCLWSGKPESCSGQQESPPPAKSYRGGCKNSRHKTGGPTVKVPDTAGSPSGPILYTTTMAKSLSRIKVCPPAHASLCKIAPRGRTWRVTNSEPNAKHKEAPDFAGGCAVFCHGRRLPTGSPWLVSDPTSVGLAVIQSCLVLQQDRDQPCAVPSVHAKETQSEGLRRRHAPGSYQRLPC